MPSCDLQNLQAATVSDGLSVHIEEREFLGSACRAHLSVECGEARRSDP